jgi:hypothetical protein
MSGDRKPQEKGVKERGTTHGKAAGPAPDSSDSKVMKHYTVPFPESPSCWVSVVGSIEELGPLINVLPAYFMRAVRHVIAQPIGEQKWKIDQAKVPPLNGTRGRRPGSNPQVMRRSLFGPLSGPRSTKYNPRDQLSVTASHPRDRYDSRFHMPEEDAMFDVKIHFIHVVTGLKIIEGAGCRQYRESTPGTIKIIPIVEIDKPGEKPIFGKERDAWFEVAESDIATFNVRPEKACNT